MTDPSANHTSQTGRRKPCIACQEPIRSAAGICPHCGSSQSRGGLQFLGKALKWIGAITALLSLVAGSIQLNGLLQASRERSEAVQRLVRAADMQIGYGDLDSALQLVEQAIELQPGSRAAGERQVTVAMMLLRRGFDYAGGGYGKKIDSLLPVLYRGAVDVDPVRAADALAHIGLANRIRQFDQNKQFAVQEYFERALALDADNVFAHVFWAECCLTDDMEIDCGNDMAAAEGHYAMAMQDGRQQEYVRRQRFDRLRNTSAEGADILLIDEMVASWRNRVPLDEQQQSMILFDLSSFSYPDEQYGRKLQALLQRCPPAEVLGMLEWAGEGRKWEQHKNGPGLLALMAYLTELSGNLPLAMERYRAVRARLRWSELDGNLYYTPIREKIDWALAALLEIRPGRLGIHYEETTEELARSLGMAKAQGLFISDVAPDSPAATGGLAAGDVVLEIEGRDASKLQTMEHVLGIKAAGDSLSLTILRNGERKQPQLTLGETKAPADFVQLKSLRSKTTQLALLMDHTLYQPMEVALGERTLWITTLTGELRIGFKLDRDAAGVLIFDAQPGGWDSSLRSGDLILAVNNQPVNSADEAAVLVRQARETGGRSLLFSRLRAGERQTVAVTIN